jgi:hypothetical protein
MAVDGLAFDKKSCCQSAFLKKNDGRIQKFILKLKKRKEKVSIFKEKGLS